jgi:peptidyl-prolyl cis-trans isomerase SurA
LVGKLRTILRAVGIRAVGNGGTMHPLNVFSAAGLRLVAFATLAVVICGAGLSPAAAQSTIRVLVNDEPITSYDIQNRGKMLQLFTRGREGEKEAVEQLIDERLMMQEAARRNVAITDEQVEQEFSERANQSKLTAAQFSQALRQSGVDPKTFTSFLRANMAWGEIVRARFRATVEVSEQDVTAALTGENAADESTVYEYILQQILFIVPAGSGTEAERRSQANAFRSNFQGCEASLQQAAGKSGVVVKPNVRREESQLAPQLSEALAKLGVGGISEPEAVEEGIQLVAICEKKEIAGRTKATEEARSEIRSERGQLLARRYLRDLRSDSVIEYR